MFETFEHTADIGLRITASSWEELFSEAGRGLFSLIVANLDDVRETESRQVEIAGKDKDYLLFDWLNELLALFEVERFVGRRYNVQFTSGGMTGSIWGEPIEPHLQLEHEVKAITYHQLQAEQTADGYFAQVIVDI